MGSRSAAHEAEFRALRDHLIHLGDFLSANNYGASNLGEYWRQVLPDDPRVTLSGLRMAANDTLEMTRDLPPQAVADADEYLRQRGVLTLTERRLAAGVQLPEILARGKIRTVEEYYLLRERVLDMSDNTLDRAGRAAAERILTAFEAERGKPGSRAV